MTFVRSCTGEFISIFIENEMIINDVIFLFRLILLSACDICNEDVSLNVLF